MTNPKLRETLLLVFARALVREMTRGGYWKEWSSRPLSELLPNFLKLLDNHPRKLGRIVYDAYNIETRSVGGDLFKRLGEISANHPRLFGGTRQSYLDQYTSSTIGYQYTAKNEGMAPRYSSEQKALLENIARAVIRSYALLNPSQERNHQTLDNVVKWLAPIYYLDSELENIGFDLMEYRDYWRDMPAKDRPAFEHKVLSYNLD